MSYTETSRCRFLAVPAFQTLEPVRQRLQRHESESHEYGFRWPNIIVLSKHSRLKRIVDYDFSGAVRYIARNRHLFENLRSLQQSADRSEEIKVADMFWISWLFC